MQKFKIFELFITCVFCVCNLSACKEPPKEQVVVYKGSNELEKKILDSQPEEKRYFAPEQWNDIYNLNDQITITIDAAIKIPTTSKFPVMIISPKEITQDDADKFINALFGNAPIFDASTSDIITKEQRIKDIQDFMSFMSDVKSEDSVLYINMGGDSGVKEEVRKLQAELSTLPDSIEAIPSDTRFKTKHWDDDEELSGFKTINIITDYETDSPPSIFITKNESNKMNQYIYNNFTSSDAAPTELYSEKFNKAKGLSTTKEHAIQLANDILAKLELKDMVLDTIAISPTVTSNSSYSSKPLSETNPYVYSLFFMRKIGDVPWTYTTTMYSLGINHGNLEKMEENQYRESWTDESIVITVDDSGVSSLEYNAPTKINGVLAENSELLDFETIKSKFIEQIGRIYQPAPDEGIIKREFHINEIRLGYAKVARQDTMDEYLLVPAWDFFGSDRTFFSTDFVDSNFDEYNSYREEIFKQSYLTINAIDGSIINRGYGY